MSGSQCGARRSPAIRHGCQTVEQFGEGLFFTFDRDALQDWRARPEVQSRIAVLRVGADRWLQQRRQRGENVSDRTICDQLCPEYLLSHSLAHALISEVAIDCGYPASSIHERIYISSSFGNIVPAVGVLIYTASAGNQGTLGGLVEVSRRFALVLESVLERRRLCSGDPVCADHDPGTAADDRTLHGAACHGCLVIAETSCEARNLFLAGLAAVSAAAARKMAKPQTSGSSAGCVPRRCVIPAGASGQGAKRSGRLNLP
jgi:hypothetical protein